MSDNSLLWSLMKMGTSFRYESLNRVNEKCSYQRGIISAENAELQFNKEALLPKI